MTQNSINTSFTKMFGIKYPIVSAPMFLVSNADMIIAMAKAGGIGAMPALNCRTTEEFEAVVKKIKAATDESFGTKSSVSNFNPEKNSDSDFLRGKPFGINMILLGNDRLAADMEIAKRYRIPWIITSLGNPTETIKEVHEYGGKVFCDVINLKHALKVKAAGADGLITVSAGAGGHFGPISMNVLVPWLKKETGLPVLAAGGISTGDQVLSALALGADAAYLGTRFIATKESGASEDYKEMILKSSPEDVVNSAKVTGHDCNFLKESLDKYESGETGLKRWKDVWSAGQGVGLINDIPSIGELVNRLVEEYEIGLKKLCHSREGGNP